MTDNDEKQNKNTVPEKKERVKKKSDEAKKRASFSDRKKKEKARKEQPGPLVHEQSDISEHVHSHTIDDNIVAFERKKEKKKRLKNAGVVTKAITRYESAPEEGLTDEQVAERINEGAVNAIKNNSGKTYGSILVNNIFTFFNMLTFAVFIAMIVVIKEPKELSKLFFMAIVLINVLLGIIQEIKSKRATDRLKLITAATAQVIRGGKKKSVPTAEVVLDDVILFETGKQVCSDSIVLSGEVEVNESLLTGESEPVIKKPGMPLFSGSYIVGGSCVARVDRVGADNYVEKLSSYARRYKKPKSEMRASVTGVIKAVTCFIVPIAIIMFMTGINNGGIANINSIIQDVSGSIIGMIPSGMFLLTSVALYQSVIRLSRRKIVVKDLYCIEMLARVNVLCLDKTGTITDGTMRVAEVEELSKIELKHSVKDIIGSMLVATGDNNMTAIALLDKFGYSKQLTATAIVPFTSQKKLSAVTFGDEGTFVLGAPEFVMKKMPVKIEEKMHEYAKAGMRVLVLAYSEQPVKDHDVPEKVTPVCLIAIEDHIRPEAPEIIDWFKENGVQVKIISGDNPVTVAEVAKRVGVEGADRYISLEGLSTQQVEEAASRYTVFGRVSPEQKCILVKALKRKGANVAMTGDGVNDILAMHEADCAIAMGSGSDAAKNVCHLLLSDSSFSALPLVVREGRRVVNNVQNSSALYLMKTFMSIVLSIIAVVLSLAGVSKGSYFFDTSNLLALEFFIIGLPSIVLATQPNDRLISGKFISNVFKKAIPCGIGLVFTVMTIYLVNLSSLMTFSVGEYTTILVAGTVFTGFFALVKICMPMDRFKIVTCVVDFCLCLFAMTGLIAVTNIMGLDLFGTDTMPITALSFPSVTFLLSVVFASYFVLSLCDAVIVAMDRGKAPAKNKEN